jgi:hypothetical protein
VHLVAQKNAALGAILLPEGINAVAQSGRPDQVLEAWDCYTSADGANLVNLREAQSKKRLESAAICVLLALTSVLGWQYFRVRYAERDSRTAQLTAEATN